MVSPEWTLGEGQNIGYVMHLDKTVEFCKTCPEDVWTYANKQKNNT